MTDIEIRQHEEQATAVIRERVATSELPQFFARAYHETMAAIQDQRLHPTGPPFALYHGKPTDAVDVEAGFPVSGVLAPAGAVHASTLPGGRVVEAMHVGPYDTMLQTYDAVMRYMADQLLTPSEVMWEVYLSDPQQEPDPATWRTQIFWPVAG